MKKGEKMSEELKAKIKLSRSKSKELGKVQPKVETVKVKSAEQTFYILDRNVKCQGKTLPKGFELLENDARIKVLKQYLIKK